MSVFDSFMSGTEAYRLDAWWDSLPIEAKRQLKDNYEGDT